jgi:putative ABC transport system permease protein
VAVAVTLGVLFGLRVFDMNGRTIVPLTGMVVGNSIAATVLVGRRITEEMRDKREEVEARLALGLPGPAAARPYVRGAVRTALVPQIETTKAVGIVFLPGAMVGLILAGADPMQAVRVQLAVMYLVLGSVAMTTSVVAIGVERRLITPDHRLVTLPPRGVG